MDGITLMVEEHGYIKRMLAVMRRVCQTVLDGQEINFDDFDSMIDFVKNYADNHHHGKEEKILFNRMIDEIGGTAEKLVRHGMLVEHDLGRLYIMNLKEALEKVKNGENEAKLDVIANAVSYTHLLTRHIDKEDNAAYPFARRGLSSETLNEVNRKCDEFEHEQLDKGIQMKYLQILEQLEKQYN